MKLFLLLFSCYSLVMSVAMVLKAPHRELELEERSPRRIEAGQLGLKVRACGVCRTDLHLRDGELPDIPYPIVPGHEIVGEVVAVGEGVSDFAPGDRVGVPWLGWTCGECDYCRSGRENLCDRARFTGYQIDGGYADTTVADARYCFRLPDSYSDEAAAPLLCAGLIGYRSLRMAGEGRRLGFYGFGAAAHIVTQVARHQGREVYAFVRSGDQSGMAFAEQLGAEWVGPSDRPAPEPLDAAIIYAPVGDLVPVALRAVAKGGTVVCAGIHMSDIPRFPYRILWEERILRSVANLTRRDAEEFLQLASEVPIETHVTPFPLKEANEALRRLREGAITGAAVLVP